VSALLDKVRALDAFPRLGEQRTLDLRGNDLRARGLPFSLTKAADVHATGWDYIYRTCTQEESYAQGTGFV
jgi:hypothetical protein